MFDDDRQFRGHRRVDWRLILFELYDVVMDIRGTCLPSARLIPYI